MLKGNNTIKLLVVLAVLVGVFFILKFTGNDNRSKSFRSELVNIDPETITKVEILTPEDSTYLEKTSESWQVNGTKSADENTVKSLLKNLNSIKPSRMASRSEEQWKDFQVDESGIRVVAYEGTKKALDIILGRFDVEGQRSFYSYVRLSEESDTYVAQDFMRMSVSTGSEAYRNGTLFGLKKDSVSSIEFNYPDSAFTLTRADQGWQINTTQADSAATAKYLSGLNMVSSRNFRENEGYTSIYDVVYNLNNGKSIQVTNYGEDRISSSENTAEFWQDETVANKLFKGKSYFLGTEN